MILRPSLRFYGIGRLMTAVALVAALLMSAWAQEAEIEDGHDVWIGEEIFEGGDEATERSDEGLDLRRGEVVRVGQDARIEGNETASELVVVFGSALMEGELDGEMVVVCGEGRVDGPVRGGIVVIGSLELGKNARVDGDVVVIWGSLSADPQASIRGSQVELSWAAVERVWTGLEEKVPLLRGLKRWVFSGLFLGRPLPHQAGWWWWMALVCVGLYVGLALVFARPLAVTVRELSLQPVGAFFAGILGFVVLSMILMILLATGIGLLVAPLVFCALVLAIMFGKVAVYQCVGQRIGGLLKSRWLSAPLPALLLGLAVFYALYTVPVLGFLIWGVLAPIGLGAVALVLIQGLGASRAPVMEEALPPGLASDASAPVAVDDEPEAETVQPSAGLPPVIDDGVAELARAETLSMPRAGFWVRLAATFIDMLLIGALSGILHLGDYFLFFWALYHIGMWSWRGTTVGGVIFGLKVVRQDGKGLDFGIALVRFLAGCLSALCLFIGFFWVGWTQDQRSWHDLIAGTLIVRVPRGTSLL